MSSSPPKSRLIHESLNDISQSIRFLAVGIASQIFFMAGYNFSIHIFEPRGYPASTIYAAFYTCYIPFGHMLQGLFVFGWPEQYFSSLLSNAPIGFTAMALGTLLTGFLSRVRFDGMVEDLAASAFGKVNDDDSKEEGGEFYASLVVLVVTSVWTYLLSQYVNAAPVVEKVKGEKEPGKEL